MTILILGITGRTGKYVLEEALKNKYTVHALVRNKNKVHIHSDQLVLFEGIPTDKAVLADAMQKCEAVISVLNISRTSDFPWAKLRTPTTFLSDSIKNVMQVATEQSIKRIIVCSAWGTNETKKDLPGWFRWIINHSHVGAAYKDHEVQESLLQHSPFDFTIVRPTGLTNSTREQGIQVNIQNTPKPKMTISRRSVAIFMMKILAEKSFPRQNVTISRK
jgi:uncharacterized protein YbjT (DUF2867 family)